MGNFKLGAARTYGNCGRYGAITQNGVVNIMFGRFKNPRVMSARRRS